MNQLTKRIQKGVIYMENTDANDPKTRDLLDTLGNITNTYPNIKV
jgi:hypothetical protein